ncbi:hypothetical protein Ddye_028796 [Dipteronia dyeriana]|uniref:Uncharacterized protein n=1 Tax=Dipteronia dyeriana TaxID=168575 RepID=A0AAD9WK12_9ROSI|nr:hypothetical protein Ddye_028796 [Dipteronia dyeriana]
MPSAKAARSTNAYVSSFPAPPTFLRSPSHLQYPDGVSPDQSPPYQSLSYQSPPTVYCNRSPQAYLYAYSPEASPPPLARSYPGAPMNYPAYGGYDSGLAPAYQQANYHR